MRSGFSLLAGRNGKTKKGKLGAAKLPRWLVRLPPNFCARWYHRYQPISAAKLGRKLHQTEIMSDYQSWHQFGAA